MEDEMIDIPSYFICPISLQIMKDPVTAVSGITYDRESIEFWLSTAEEALCPVTKQPLPRDSDLTPNHTLRRLIQAWCVTNASHGIDRIPTPKSPLSRSHVVKILRNLKVPEFYKSSLNSLDLLANENEKNRKCLADAGTSEVMVSLIISWFKENRPADPCLAQVLRILHLNWIAVPEKKRFIKENCDFIDSLLWVLQSEVENDLEVEVQSRTMLLLKMAIEVASTNALERLKLEFFKQTINVLKRRTSEQAVKAALHVLIEACPWGRNRMKIVEAGAVFVLVELEIEGPEKSISELSFILLAHLCACADGRAQLIKHAGGLAVVAKRMLRVSPAVDDRTVHIVALIGKFSATDEVLAEMLRVGVVSKLCMVLHAGSDAHLKKKARETLRLHSHVWNNSPCIALYLLTSYPK